MNACSQLVGASIFGGLPFVFYHNDYVNHPRSQTKDLVVISLYCFGVAVCFTFSAMQVWSKKATLPSLVQISLTSRSFHILADHSRAVSKLWNQLDYVGIFILMWAAGIATIFYGFLCNERLQLIYTSTVCTSSRPTSRTRIDHLPVHLFCTVLCFGDIDSALRLITIQKLARSALRYFWLELRCVCHPRARLVWMGGTATPHVPGVHDLDDCGKCARRNNICSTGNLSYAPILATS